MEGSGEFNLVRDSSEGNANQRTREDANEIFEITSTEAQDLHPAPSSSSRRGQKQRHTRDQIQQLEKFFEENPHPNESERLDIGRKLNLEANQVKFWFQNRRTQLKTQTDRHENLVLKQENESLRVENMALKEAMQNTICKNCGGHMLQVDRSTIEQDLMIENGRLREELSQAKSVIRQLSGMPSSSSATPFPMEHPNPLAPVASKDPPVSASRSERTDGYLEQIASSAMEELMKLSQVNAPLWNKNMETGGESLNLYEYLRSFPPLLGSKPLGFVSEASRATALVSLRSLDLVEALLDADRWREMFAGMIGSCATTKVISDGNGGSRNSALQIMQAEIQLISPSVSARVVKFIRFSRQQAEGVWAVVDLSIDADHRRESALMSRRLPSGCILHDMPNGFSKVTWIEHTEYDERPIHHNYRRLLSSGLGFGAQKWICALLRHCEWSKALSISSSSPNANYQLSQTARTCLKGLARRMTSIFCAGVCLTGGQRWNLVSDGPRIMTRGSTNGEDEPSGTIVSATTAVWIPTTHRRLFDLLLNKDLRCMWDVLCHGNATMKVAHFPTSHGHDDHSNPNSISLLSANETASDMTGSLIVYAPVDLPMVSLLMNNGDTSSAALLPCGLYMVPGSGEFGASSGERGCMVTVGFQMLVEDLITSNSITMDTINTVNDLVSQTVQGIKEIVRSTI